MITEWDEKWDTGVVTLDAQHREIFMGLTRLSKILQTTAHQPNPANQQESDECAYYAALFGSLSAGELNYELELLITRIEAHFLFEEELHSAASYQLAVPHKQLHDEFIARIKKYYAAHCRGEDVIDKLFRILVNWFGQHVMIDKDFTEMVKHHDLAITPDSPAAEDPNESNWFARARKAISNLSNTP